MTTFHMLCGLPGSGKSYYARENARIQDTIISSDSIREELYGDAAIQNDPNRVFNIMFQNTRASLKAGRTTYYDATNLNSKRRINLLKSLKKIFSDLYCVCIIIATPIDVCHERNAERDRVVPPHVIDRMLRQFEIPYKEEGWDKILVIHNYTFDRDFDYYRRVYAREVEKFGDQGNSHHSLTLKDHCQKCGNIAMCKTFDSDIIYAALIHDYGKIFTATRWEKDKYKEVHYPNHANVGAYMALSMSYNLHIAQLVGFHMLPYTDNKCQDTWRARLGENLWKEIIELHHYDEAAH